MNLGLVLLGILPILAYTVADLFASPRAALWSAMAFALGEVLFSLLVYGELDALTLFSFALVIILGAAALWKKTPLLFKLQPALLGCCLSLLCAGFYYGLDKPILVAFGEKYLKQIFVDRFYSQVIAAGYLDKATLLAMSLRDLLLPVDNGDKIYLIIVNTSRDLALFFIIHAALVAFAAVKLSTLWWALIRVPLFYLLLVSMFFLERLLVG